MASAWATRSSGDTAYGWKPNAEMARPRGGSCCTPATSRWSTPETGKRLDLRAPLPADFKAQIKALRAG